MTDLGGGVYVEPDDPWGDLGHPDPTHHGESCPTCERTSTVQHNTGTAGGSVCTYCWTVFTHAPGEHNDPKNVRRRELWQHHYEKEPGT